MSARGYGSASEGRSMQAPGMMRHGPGPSLGSLRHPIDPPLPPPELLENNLAIQGAEIDKLFRENHRLAATHGALRHGLLAAQQELQRVQSHASQVGNDTGLQIRGLLDKISKMEADIKAGEEIEKELHRAHIEAQGLASARADLMNQIQQGTSDLEKMHSDIKKLPELHSEMERLMQEHQKLRTTFEREKGGNMELVQKMHAMERNMLSMAKEVEKLRSEVQEAEKRAKVPTPSSYQSSYGAVDASRNTGQDTGYGQTGAYSSGAYGQGSLYANGGYGQAAQGGYSDLYGRSSAQAQMMNNMASEKVNPYAANTGEKVNPYGSAMTAAAYNTAQGAGAYDSAAAMGAGSGPGAYDVARASSVSAGGPYDARAAAVAGGGMYDPSRGTVASASSYEAARMAAAGGNAQPTRAGEGAAGSYNPAMAAGNAYGYYDAGRAMQMPMQR